MATEGNYSEPVCIPVADTPEDFWRSNAGADMPDGTNDVTEDISRSGGVGVGPVPLQTPVAQLDVATQGRTGASQISAADGLAVTAAGSILPNYVVNAPPAKPATAIAGFWHSNQTQGIEIYYNGIRQGGSAGNAIFTIDAGASGQFTEAYKNPAFGQRNQRNNKIQSLSFL